MERAAGRSQAGMNGGRPGGMKPTTGRMGSPKYSAVVYAKVVLIATSTSSFISERSFAGQSHEGCGPFFLISCCVYFFSHIMSCKRAIIDRPRARPTKLV